MSESERPRMEKSDQKICLSHSAWERPAVGRERVRIGAPGAVNVIVQEWSPRMVAGNGEGEWAVPNDIETSGSWGGGLATWRAGN